MRTSTRMIAIACAVATGPLLAHAAIGIRDYVSSAPDEEGFTLDGGGFIDPGGVLSSLQGCDNPSVSCDVYGGGGDDWWPGGGGGGWGGGGGGGGSGGGDCSADPSRCESEPPSPPSPENPLACLRANDKVYMTFDGRTIRVTAYYAPNNAHAASVAAYVAGIERIWTVDFPEAQIGIVTDLVPRPNGFIFSFDPNYHFNAGLVWGANNVWEMRLGPLDGYTEPALSGRYLVAAHEFGHFWFGQNSHAGSELPISLMANAADGQILASDLHKMVEACQTGGWAQ